MIGFGSFGQPNMESWVDNPLYGLLEGEAAKVRPSPTLVSTRRCRPVRLTHRFCPRTQLASPPPPAAGK